MAKIINAYSIEEDYIEEWENSWTVDHQNDINGNFNSSAACVYFNEPDFEIIIIQIFAAISEPVQPHWWSKFAAD